MGFGWLEKRVSGKQDREINGVKKGGAYLTFKHCELGTGVDLSDVVGGRALVNSFIPVRAQRLDPQHRARAVVKLDHLKCRGKREEARGQQIY